MYQQKQRKLIINANEDMPLPHPKPEAEDKRGTEYSNESDKEFMHAYVHKNPTCFYLF